VVGTYVGATIAVLVALALEGPVGAIILVVWAMMYQQIENYFLAHG
jgi:predicted PurR-regulated permease PerM